MYTLLTLSLLGSLTVFSPGLEYGACCYPSGDCAYTDCAECEAAGGVCLPGYCDYCWWSGTCCYPSGYCAEEVSGAECEAAGGEWYIGVACDGIYCWPADGACCLADQSCIMTLEYYCADMGGIPYEPGTPCAEAHCVHGPGDLNCDGVLTAFDIDPFVLALTDRAGYEAAYPGCDYMLADINRDGTVNAFDIDPFVACLTGAGCGPCP